MTLRISLGVVLGLVVLAPTAVWGTWFAPLPKAESAQGDATPPTPQPTADTAATADEPAPEVDPLGPNGACYVCHVTFVKEEFSKVHLDNKVTCVKCHGLSDKHANDENVGATKPDITFQRPAIDASCHKCHTAHDVPAKAVITRFLERGLSRNDKIACIDCHGLHKIEEAE